ncbi:S9 family peptidase [Algoriphagus boritolerans]|uniref:Dipeptidyl aminopeptidase/acylaminoacyl peptidase n=1 Tax=Algoriphagus boritolerans DSM 17298 = JCM 18970 TaxID=1120964 RepID=A0A1H5XPK1_9BACT|nr:prolyl oligopeptidase family serine peptidase [Algoriphagus boritolerans]SEG13622.1 Dipeptidyl aminopeptidase/acylaminoacyl peptidase [Algoriphagus boritolerans DSM 17298 = JCM 18970]
MARKLFLLPILLFIFIEVSAQSTLSVDYIMRDPKWMGTFPSAPSWGEDSNQIFFKYNQENDPADSLYKIELGKPSNIAKVHWPEEKGLAKPLLAYNSDQSLRIYRKDNAIIFEDQKKKTTTTLLTWHEPVSNLRFLADENRIAFNSSGNIYVYDRSTKSVSKSTNISNASKPASPSEPSSSDPGFLEAENLDLLKVVRARKEAQEKSKAYRAAIRESNSEFIYYTQGKNISNLQLSPDEKFATFSIYTPASNQNTIVPNYVDASGYTENLNTRSKVGNKPAKVEIGIYDLTRDTVYFVTTSNLPGIKDLPDYVKDYPEKTWEEKERSVTLSSPIFSPDGKRAIIQVRAFDNKDRWITEVDLTSGELKTLDRQRDEAWIGGPGIGGGFGGGTFGWLPDNQHIYFQSEASGFSHLYLLDVNSGLKKALTSGKYEVFDPFLSKDQKYWYLTTSEVDPGERHFYRMPVMGGTMEKLTSMTGNNEVALSPDEKKLAIIHSYSNKPAELFVQENKVGAKPQQLTAGQSEEFKAYRWRDPQIVKFTAEDGAQVPARLYLPEASKKNGAAVIFVHGAGYLQNVHKWWSSYFREYMFHNLLTDLGYTVLDIDYRASAGYGRDWRTGIYRHMGGKDLSDQVDGAKFLMAEHGVESGKIGIYGGSYGGFITLMALFNHGDIFTSGAALRSVTDWAHYNHGYTANILNTPEDDPIAYRRSSPIYFAEGLKGNLLIAHGMLDVNVHFQDVVRLSQRLIELGKDNWEMAVYPVEDHGFVEPSSWTDEYKRILKLFNTTLLEKKQ